jgi:hypothetical protein
MTDSTRTGERFGWRTFRPPPPIALVFGALYGAVAGAIIAWDIAVLIRGFRIVRRRVGEEIEERRRED